MHSWNLAKWYDSWTLLGAHKFCILWQYGPLKLTENLNPFQGPTHSDPIINKHTEQVKKYLWIYHDMH